MRQFQSNADEIRYYIKELLSSGKPYPRTEIFQSVRSAMRKTGKIPTEGMLTGALRGLLDREPEYRAVERGVYQYLPEGAPSEQTRAGNRVADKVSGILRRTKNELVEACQCNLLEISDEDLSSVRDVQEVLSQLDRMIEKMERH